MIFNHPLAGSVLNAAILIIWAIWVNKSLKKANGVEKTEKALKELKVDKVDKNGCDNFKTRIGNESDEHRKKIEKINRALIFLVTTNGGNPSDMKLI